MTDHIEVARKQATGISAAINGDASAMRPMPTEGDPDAIRKLTIALLHAQNAIEALVEEAKASKRR